MALPNTNDQGVVLVTSAPPEADDKFNAGVAYRLADGAMRITEAVSGVVLGGVLRTNDGQVVIEEA